MSLAKEYINGYFQRAVAMVGETAEATVSEPRSTDSSLWLAGAGGGLVAGILMGLLMHYVMGIMTVVGGLYTIDTVVAGWTFHLVHAVIFGLLFAAGMTSPVLGKYDFGPVVTTVLGVVWGVILWLFAAGVVMPVWMGAVGMTSPPVPNWAPMSGIGHLVYGAALGAVFALVDR